ncbi:serine protease [Amycolatopsis ultiminotia]|uniref:Serine protease n=1 Tax=Amycolatopsis ultiminotia TaxID=543629 RepID=A0ABP6WWX0_9PSEU
MTRRLLGGAIAAVAVFALVTAPTASAATTSFSGAVALSNCSGSVVKPAATPADAPALVLSNGHCLESGFPEPGQVIVDQDSSRTFDLLSEDGQSTVGTVTAKKVAYATMTDTDVSLYQLTDTYAGIKDKYGVAPLELAGSHPEAGTAIDIVSGYWKKIYSCTIDGFVPELHEGGWVWKDSVRYASGCDTIGGTSGSPLVDHATGKVVGVNNTANEDGERCTENNPCEVDESGNVTVHAGTKYGEETYGIPACLTAAGEVDLNQQGCTLPKP